MEYAELLGAGMDAGQLTDRQLGNYTQRAAFLARHADAPLRGQAARVETTLRQEKESRSRPSDFDAGPTLDAVQSTLDWAGFVPGAGAGPDVANAGISAGRGNWAEAGMNLIAAIPFFGDGAKGGKMMSQAMKQGDDTAVKAAQDGLKPIDKTRPKHGTPAHDATAFNEAKRLEASPEHGNAAFNQQLRRPDGTTVPGHRPDAQATRTTTDGKQVQDVTEVQSPSQNDTYMSQKEQKIRDALGKDAGEIQWIRRDETATRQD